MPIPLVHQKWPDQIFLLVNVVLPAMVPLVWGLLLQLWAILLACAMGARGGWGTPAAVCPPPPDARDAAALDLWRS